MSRALYGEPELVQQCGSRRVCRGRVRLSLSRIMVMCVRRTDESEETGEELGMNIAALLQLKISLKLKMCLVIDTCI